MKNWNNPALTLALARMLRSALRPVVQTLVQTRA